MDNAPDARSAFARMAKEIMPNEDDAKLNIRSNVLLTISKWYDKIFSSIAPINPYSCAVSEESKNGVVEEDQSLSHAKMKK